MQMVVEQLRRLSRMGSVYDAPVEAEMRIKVSNASQVGGAPYGPAMKPVNELFCSPWFLTAKLYIRFEIPLCARIASWTSLQWHLLEVS